MNSNNEILDKKYPQYHDYYFKSVLKSRANGLLKFIGIPYMIETIILSEYTTLTPGISRIDFAGDARKDGKMISLIVECQSELPTDEDIKRFFQYVASLRIFKNQDVELYILCTKKAPYTKKEFILNDECTYTMHVISLKDFKASKIFNSIEDKIKNNEKITDEDIASLQVIVYTDYDESELEILLKARMLIEKITEISEMDINEKKAIIYLFDVLSANMLNDEEMEKYEEDTYMLLNPTDRYLERKGRREGKRDGKREGKREGKRDIAQKLLGKGFSMDEVVEITGLSRDYILNGD